MQYKQQQQQGCAPMKVVRAVMYLAAAFLLARTLFGSPAGSSLELSVSNTVSSADAVVTQSERTGSAELVAAGDERFTVIVLSWKRYKSLERLLKSLDAADYQGDRVRLVVQIDGGSGKDWKTTQKVARDFEWKHGSKEVRVLKENKGLMHAWLSCWTPKDDDENAVILEDDLTVSPVYYRYLKSMWANYGDRPEIAGVTLQRERLVATNAKYRTIMQDEPFGYKLLGTWGFSPSPSHWRKFLQLDFKKMNPHVSGLITSRWFARQRRGKMWSQFWIWYCNRYNLYNIYLTARNRKTFATNWREAGVHYGKTKGPDFQVVEAEDWLDVWDNPPANLDLYSWGLKKEGVSTPPGALEPTTDGDAVRSIDIEVPSASEERETEEQEPAAQEPQDQEAEEAEEAGGEDLLEPASVRNEAALAEIAAEPEGNNGEVPDIVKTARGVVKDGIMFMQLLNEGFVELTKAWICNVQYMPRVLDRTLFVCTDKAAFDQLNAFARSAGLDLVIHFEEHKAPAAMTYGQLAYYQFILYRASLLKNFLVNGVPVFLVESDATWFGDPVSYLLDEVDPSADVIAMHNDYKSPTNINGGFLWLRATKGTTEIVRRLHSGFKQRIDRLVKTGKDYVGKDGNEQQYFKALLLSKKYNPDGLIAKTIMLPSDKFAPGLWYKKDYRASSLEPLVVLNNWVRGNDAKKRRAIQLGHWFVNEDQTQCTPKYMKVPTTADLAVAAQRDMTPLLELAAEAKLINNNVGQMVALQFVTAHNVAKAKNWACSQAKSPLLPHTIFVCRDTASCQELRELGEASGLQLNLYEEQVPPADEAVPYRAALIYALLRADLSVFVVRHNTMGFSAHPRLYFDGAEADASKDVAATAAVREGGADASLLLRDLALFKNTEGTRSALGKYLVAVQKYAFTKMTTGPAEKRYLDKVTQTELRAGALPADGAASLRASGEPWGVFTDAKSADLEAQGLWSLSDDKAACKAA